MADFAPGIKNKRYKGHLSELPIDAVLTMVRQRHDARRAGLHEDLRIGSPAGLYSFAVPKFLPENLGEKRLAVPQPIHAYSYKDFQGKLPKGYGEGTVSKIEESPVVILERSENKLKFTRGTSKDSPVYTMIRTKNGNFICSIKKPGEPTAVLTYQKEHFKELPLNDVADLIDKGAAVAPKIDGAGAIAYLSNKGINVYGIRQNAKGQHPEYTDYITSALRTAKVPEELQGKLIRGEVYGVRNGKPIHPSELSGVLNSTLVHAIDKKQKKGIQLMLAALAENKNGVDDYDTDTVSLAKKLNNPNIHGMPVVTGEAAKRLVEQIASGRYPMTREGVVVHQQGKRPVKAKVKSDYDVVIRDVFKADTDRGDMAGGFTYSYPDSDEIVGRVGTGFSDAMRKDMWQNPQNYIGQTARVHSQEQLGSGALRAPGFLALRAD